MSALANERAAALLTGTYRQALAALSGRALVRAALARTPIPALCVRVFALGKAACGMAEGAADALRVEFSGLIAAHERAPHPREFELWTGEHPLPGPASARAGEALLAAAERCAPEDFALFLLSGGGSAIAALPAEGLSPEDLAATTAALLRSGASIDALNAVRKHLTRLGGGQLAARCPARKALALVLSDVASGELSALASGPTLPDPTSFADALAVAEGASAAAGALIPRRVLDHLRAGSAGHLAETPGPGDARLTHVHHRVLATPHALAEEARRQAERAGLAAHVVASGFDGDFEALAAHLAERAQSSLAAATPTLLIATGEPRLCVPPRAGEGGRMQQLALRLARDLSGADFCALCAGSDGRDGATEFAGALVDGQSAGRARARGFDLDALLERCDATRAVRALDLGLRRFSSGTNLTDLALVLCRPTALADARPCPSPTP